VRPQGAGDERATESRWPDAAGWIPFTVGLPRWPFVARLRGRHPLVRTTDRIEAAVLVLVVVVSLLTLPIAGALGTAAHESLRHSYAEQADSRHLVDATVGDVASRGKQRPSADVSVPATWLLDGVEHTGTVRAAATVEDGDTVQVWVDDTGAQVAAPGSADRAAAEAVTIGLLVWVCTVVTAAALFIVTRRLCDRVRYRRWEKGLHELTDHGGGPARRQP
jgi:hypothetical protein